MKPAPYHQRSARRLDALLDDLCAAGHAYADALRFLAGEADRLADVLDENGPWEELVAAQRAWGRAADNLMHARHLARLAAADTVRL